MCQNQGYLKYGQKKLSHTDWLTVQVGVEKILWILKKQNAELAEEKATSAAPPIITAQHHVHSYITSHAGHENTEAFPVPALSMLSTHVGSMNKELTHQNLFNILVKTTILFFFERWRVCGYTCTKFHNQRPWTRKLSLKKMSWRPVDWQINWLIGQLFILCGALLRQELQMLCPVSTQ